MTDLTDDDLKALVCGGLLSLGLRWPWPEPHVITGSVHTSQNAFRAAAEVAYLTHCQQQLTRGEAQYISDRKITAVHAVTLGRHEALEALGTWLAEE